MIKSRVRTVDKKDPVYDKFIKTIKGARSSYVTIGLHEDAGQYTEGQNPPSVVEVGLWTEFGTRSSPERSWLRSSIDEGEQQIIAWRDEVVGNVLFRGWSLNQALDTMGFRIMTLVQNKIKSNVPPPLAQSTADAKKKAGVAPVTLIDTGLMLRSVTYKVHMG